MRTQTSTKHNFALFSTAFAANHAAVVTVLNLSQLLLGDQGSYQAASLYITYAATALLLSTPALERYGARKTLLASATLYSLYVLSFPIALLLKSHSARLAVALLGGIGGGVAAGCLWAAQGTYFARSAAEYSRLAAVPIEQANSALASTFALIFLGMEVVLKLLPLCISAAVEHGAPSPPSPLPSPPAPPAPHQPTTSDIVTTSLFSVVALVSVVGLFYIRDLREGGDDDAQPSTEEQRTSVLLTRVVTADKEGVDVPAPAPSSASRLFAALELWRQQPEVLLLAPVQITFSVCASLLGVKVAGGLLPGLVPENTAAIGSLLSALVSLTAALCQHPSRLLCARFGKPPVMLSGLAAFGGLGALVYAGGAAAWAGLVCCYVLQGVGRACYEGTNKALYADFFAEHAPAAFSNIVLANGLSSSVAYFAMPSLSVATASLIAIASATAAAALYLLAEVVHRRRLARSS